MSFNTDRNKTQSTQLWVLIATVLASATVFLDGTVVNVALPTIDKQLNTGLSGLQWIINGYTLTLSALLIIGGSLGDRYGRRRVMLIGLVGFGLMSMLCGLAPSLGWLIAARVLQGISGALMVPSSLAILQEHFPSGEERGQAIGQWSGWSGIATVIGPLLGGFLVDTLSWHWVFFINIPLIITAILIFARNVPHSPHAEDENAIDWTGALLAMLGLGGLVYGLIQGPVTGWGSPPVVSGLVVGTLGLAAFPFVEAGVESPMMPLGLFKSRNFSAANLNTLCVYFGLYGLNFFLILYVQNVIGYSAFQAGLVLAPLSLVLLVLSPLLGKLAGRYGPRLFMTVGPLICAAGFLLFMRLEPDSGYWLDLFPAVLVFSLGLASVVAPLSNTVISSVPEQNSGVAAAFNNAISRVAALLAIALLGVIVTIVFNNALDHRMAKMSLSSSERQILARVSRNPTGTQAVSELPENASIAVDQSYTRAFDRVMQVCAVSASLGGIVAGIWIRNPSADEEKENLEKEG